MLHRLCGPPSIPLSFILANYPSFTARTTGYLIPFAPLAFVSQCQCRPSRVLSPLVFFPISTHFTAPPEIPSALPYSSLVVSTACPGLSPGFDGGLKKPPTDALRPIIPDNACILCLTAAAGTELADAYSPDTVIASSPGKEVHDPWAFYLHAALLRQAFAHCGKFPTAASRRSLGRVSVPVWLIILSDQLLIIALLIRRKPLLGRIPPFAPQPTGAGSYALLTRPPLETPLPVRLACVKHAASVHPEPGIELSMRFIVALLIASLFVDKADSELSFIRRHNLYPCASYSPGVRSQKYSHPCPLTSIPRASYPFSLNHGGGANPNIKTHIGFRDNQARTDDFHHVKVTLYR
ncbi:UNVERIFIED_CONTAM: hypothetical protein Sindi_2999800 [Sesamum indicum]